MTTAATATATSGGGSKGDGDGGGDGGGGGGDRAQGRELRANSGDSGGGRAVDGEEPKAMEPKARRRAEAMTTAATATVTRGGGSKADGRGSVAVTTAATAAATRGGGGKADGDERKHSGGWQRRRRMQRQS